MPSIFEIRNWSDVASFFIWTLAVSAIAKALFGSFLAAEIQYRLALRDAPRRQRMNRLNWEINNRAKWDEEVARRSPHAARQPLGDEELESRRTELHRLARSSLPWRAITYFTGCFACQAFWVGLGVYASTHAAPALVEGALSAAAYSSLAVALSRIPASRQNSAAASGPTKCKACGH